MLREFFPGFRRLEAGQHNSTALGVVDFGYPEYMNAGQCDERDRLLFEYRSATEQFSAAVAELSGRIGITSLDDYLKLHEAAETARMRSNEARECVERHILEHHC